MTDRKPLYFRFLFAYTLRMPGSIVPTLSASALRRELSYRNSLRAPLHAHECSFGKIASYIYHENGGRHGNFHPASYQAILACPEWQRRLSKSYTAGEFVPRRWDRSRSELDCANSSDALLMNIFCCPKLLERPQLCSVLGIERGLRASFGFKPAIPLTNGRADRTEIDMSLGSLLVEAKLTETDFQKAPLTRIQKYLDLEHVFAVDRLPLSGDSVTSYQLVRGVLAAYHLKRSFVVLCDARRADLVERWFRVMCAVESCDLRSRLALLTWQELASVVPRPLQIFLDEKYGILPTIRR
jgi:hypothetical protein